MDATIKMMIQGYFDSLDNMKAGDMSMTREIEDFKKELTAFAESQDDAMTFFPKFQESGLMGKFMEISTKIAMAGQATQRASQERATGEKKPVVTPAEWLEPFRNAYDAIKGSPVRERVLSVYRQLFQIGERHSDITEFLLDVERKNLLWKISSEDALGILEIRLTGMDSLNEGLTYPIRKNIEAWKESVSEADVCYLLDLLSADTARTSGRLLQKEQYVICLGTHLMVYRGPQGKEGIMEMIATGDCPRQAFMSKASNMVIAKLQTRRMAEIIRKSIGLEFDDILSDEYLRYKLISTANVCGLGKAYIQSNSNLIDLLSDAYHNEIVPDISLFEAIRRESSVMLGRWRMPDDRDTRKAEAIAMETFKDLPYLKYEDQLQGSIHLGTGEGFDI
ncbi:MAG: hypothetical protein J6L98_04150 [Bacteroidales bacterium]|nr:hypothetical protein [Bacteroidales bacterium]